MSDRIVVTGLGVVSPIGTGLQQFEEQLFKGQVGLGAATLLSGLADPPPPAFEISDFDPTLWLGPKGLRALDRSARLLCVSAHLALQESALAAAPEQEPDPELGLVCGTVFGSVRSITAFDWSGLTDGPKYVNPMEFPNTVINSPAGQAAIKHRLQGVNSTISAGLASGLYAINYAADFLRRRRASALLAGAVEEVCEESFLGFAKNGLLSPSGRLKPFSPERDGTLVGEGSAIWAMETEDRARARGAAPLLEVCGFGAAHDAFSIDSYRVRGEGAAAAIRQALESAGLEPPQIGLIVAGANGSPAGDKMEAIALREVFGPALSKIPVCAPKAGLGESLGASGALLATVAGLALRRGEAPPTPCFAGSEDSLLLSREAQPLSGEYALINSFGCDGNNAALIIRRAQ